MGEGITKANKSGQHILEEHNRSVDGGTWVLSLLLMSELLGATSWGPKNVEARTDLPPRL